MILYYILWKKFLFEKIDSDRLEIADDLIWSSSFIYIPTYFNWFYFYLNFHFNFNSKVDWILLMTFSGFRYVPTYGKEVRPPSVTWTLVFKWWDNLEKIANRKFIFIFAIKLNRNKQMGYRLDLRNLRKKSHHGGHSVTLVDQMWLLTWDIFIKLQDVKIL